MKHYTKEDLELYRNGKMSILGRISCSAHLKECKDCRNLLKELEEDDQLIYDLRNSLELFREISEHGTSTVKG